MAARILKDIKNNVKLMTTSIILKTTPYPSDPRTEEKCGEGEFVG